jgi:hypothetical protein
MPVESRSGVAASCGPSAREDPSRGRARPGPRVEAAREGRAEVGLEATIGVQREDVAAVRRLDSRVHRAGETDVPRERDHSRARRDAARGVGRAVAGSGVHDDDLDLDPPLRGGARQRRRKILCRVVRDDDDRDVCHGVADRVPPSGESPSAIFNTPR